MNFYLCRPRIRLLIRHLLINKTSEIIAPDLVRDILAEYDLRQVKGARHTSAEGSNRNLIVNTDQGKILLKIYKPEKKIPRVVHEHSILEFLTEIDFPSPRLFHNKMGKTFFIRQNSVGSISKFLEGYSGNPNQFLLPSDSRTIIAIAGETLGRLHRKLEYFTPSGQHLDGFRSREGSRWKNLNYHIDLLRKCRDLTPLLSIEDTETEVFLENLFQQADWLEETLTLLDDELAKSDLPRLIIHGDYNTGNLLIRKNNLPVVLDFELARLDWRLTDLVKAIAYYAAKRRSGLDYEKMHIFFNAYRKQYPLAMDELRNYISVWRFFLLRRIIVCWHKYCEGLPANIQYGILRSKRWLDWLATHQRELENQLKNIS